MDSLYHYTTIESSKGVPILESILSFEREEINLRGTYFKKFGSEDYQWIRKDSIPIVKELCEELGEKYDPDVLSLMPYIVSFCQTPNLTSMWEKYGGKRKGIMFEFDKTEMEKTLCPINEDSGVNSLNCLIPCLYANKDDDLKELVSSYIKRTQFPECYSIVDKIMLAFVAVKKKDDYEHEEEYRYIQLCNIISHAYYNGGNFFFDDHWVKEKDWYQYFLFPRKILKSITVGREASDADFNFVREYAIKCGLSPRKVIKEK